MPQTIIEQRESESAWRQLLVQGVLVVLLPTEDLENGCLRALVAEIFSEMILGNGISGKACEGWLLWEGITSIAKVLQTKAVEQVARPSDDTISEQSMTRLERFGLLSSARNEENRSVNISTHNEHRHKRWPVSPSRLFWTFVQYVLWASTAVRALVMILATASSLPLRSINHEASPVKTSSQPQASTMDTPMSRRPSGIKRPVVSMKLWSCTAQLLELSARMPWLLGSISMLHWGLLTGPGKVGDTDGILDR